jgi:hypothetical protein
MIATQPSARGLRQDRNRAIRNSPNPPSRGWLIGCRGDLAFAALVEGGGLGAGSAGPIARAFLRKL